MMKNFKKFCLNIASPQHVDIDESITEIPDVYQKRLDVLISNMKNKMEIINRISISFIEEAFDDADDTFQVLDSNDNGDIPVGIISKLSKELYHKSFNTLADDEQAIIKVLACYLSIQLKKN